MSQATADPRRALVVARTIWLVMVLGVVLIAVALVFIGSGRSLSAALSREAGQLFFYLSAGLGVLTIPMAVVFRGQVFKRHWVGDMVEPGGYLAGNLVAWAMCEAVCLLSLVGCFLGGGWWPGVLPGLAGWLALVALWPNGRAMLAGGVSGGQDRDSAVAAPRSRRESPRGE